ncbi:MAG: phosphoribosylamine--glycine ligase [Spirochaetaceae bacterium]|jgi:phosphoribosylamine--glycine ligase|nr:phosphoribosylamine--glycine ligase [Spirochaetaceae bacterium]
MKILVIGSGGREHAIVWKLARSEGVEKIYAAPGNGGTAKAPSGSRVSGGSQVSGFDDPAGGPEWENVDLFGRDPAEEEIQEALIRYVVREGIDLTVVGPEAPLAAGIVDRFRGAGLAVAGPGSAAARLEASKTYAKSFMEKYGVRTARYLACADPAEALAAVRAHFDFPSAGKSAPAPHSAPPPLVIKADGLAAGKGVVIAENLRTAEETVAAFMRDGSLGDAGKNIVLEEFLQGPEVSVLAAVSVIPGRSGVILPFVSARDHKRRFDRDRGPNTGGMGAIAPAPGFNAALERDFEEAILAPTLQGMEAEGFDYRGFIFFGLLLQNGRCYLLEYNVRLGDPETQAVLPLMDSDFAELCAAIENGTLADFHLAWKPGAVCAPVAVAAGYPGGYRRGDPIAFNEAAFAKTTAVCFAAGAVRGAGGPEGSGLRTAGGRVLTVSAYGADGAEARARAYRALETVHFEGMDYRRDIGEL